MPIQLTPYQKQCIDAIMVKVEEYLGRRYQQVRRVNSHVEVVWDDLAWQQKVRLRGALSGDKSWGAIRLQVAELLMSDDRRVRDLFSTKSQASLQGELVEEKETDSHRTHGALEIHDMRSLFRTIDPNLERVANLMQTYIWWDLEDAVELAKFDLKVAAVRRLEKGELTDDHAKRIMDATGVEKKPGAEEALMHELRMLQRLIQGFRLRRSEEGSHTIIVARDQSQAENPDLIIQGLASQLNLLRVLKSGGQIDDTVRNQLAQAMKVEPAAVTPENAAPFVENLIQSNRNRLRAALNGMSPGEPYNYKQRQLEALEKKFAEVRGDREIKDTTAAAPA